MGRTRKISETKEQIDKAEELVLRTKKAYDEAVTALKILREKEEKEKQDALLKAVSKSKWSYDKIMKFIQSDLEELEE